MKRIIAALIVFAIAAAVAVSSNILVLKRVEVLSGDTRVLVEAAETKNQESARAGLERLNTSWEKSDTILHMFVIHREMNEVELSVHALEEYLNGGDWELFREGSVRMLEALAHIRHSQELSLKNIF